MKRPHRPTTATALMLTALFVIGAAGPSVAAVACVCPDGQVEIETAAVCSCCHSESVDDRTVGSTWDSEGASCDDCVDVPLRVLPLKNDHLRLHIVTVDTGYPIAPAARVTGSGWDRSPRPDKGHRLALALLSSVVLLT